MLEKNSDADDVSLPGRDSDPNAEVEKRIKVGWALVGIFFTLGIFTFVLQASGLSIVPKSLTMLEYARLFAFCVACLNIGVWMWFPLEDLAVLRRWVRTRRKTLPANTSEFYAILLAMILLLLLIVGVLFGPVWFGAAGTGVFVWNAVGFSIIRRHVNEAVHEARALYGEQKGDVRELCLRALDHVETHWSCRRTGWFSDRQQIRHVTLAICFALVTLLGALGENRKSAALKLAAYVMGSATLIGAEISIAIWRTARDHALVQIREELRSIA